jgi:hypothetical protein
MEKVRGDYAAGRMPLEGRVRGSCWPRVLLTADRRRGIYPGNKIPDYAIQPLPRAAQYVCWCDGGVYLSWVAAYAKQAGNLLVLRRSVLGQKSSDLLETKESRKFPVIFEGPEKDTDSFEIELPVGYEVDDLPPPTDIESSFASYHSKTEVSGRLLKYTRTMEIKELSVPLSKMDDLKKFYRLIAGDERNTAVLKPATAAASN